MTHDMDGSAEGPGRSADKTPDHDPEIVATVTSDAEAELLVGLLRNHGIPAFLRGDDGGGQFPSLDALRGVRVLVSAADGEQARAVLRNTEPLREDEPPLGPASSDAGPRGSRRHR